MPSPIIAIPRRMNYGRPSIQRIGPWPKGMVGRYIDFAGDQAASLIDNCDVLPDGELKQRQPFQTISGVANCYQNNATIQTSMNIQPAAVAWRCELVYQAKLPTDSAGNPSTIGVFRSQNNIAGASADLYAILNLSNGTLLASGVLHLSNFILYNGKIYAIAGTRAGANAGKVFWWSASDPTGTNGSTAVIAWGTAEPPNSITIFKDRMYAYNADINLATEDSYDRIWFSLTGDPLTWTGNPDAGFFALSSNSTQLGAKQRVRSIVGLRSTLYIFTTTTSWALSMPSSGIPTNGTLQIINNRIGVANDRCVTTYENKLYIMSTSGIYELINSTFIDIGYTLGEQITYALTAYDVGGISIASDKLYVSAFPLAQASPDGSQVVTPFAYVFNLKSRAWSTVSIGDTGFGGVAITNIIKIIPYVNNYTNSIVIPVRTFTGDLKYTQGAIFTEPTTGKVYHMAPDQHHMSTGADNGAGWCDIWGASNFPQSIIMTVWTQDLTGATVEQASWKRYYSVTVNIYKKYAASVASTLSLVGADHNSNPIVNASITLPTTPPNATFFSIKQYTSLRARHIQYFIQIDTHKTGPHSLLSLDILAKLKQSEQSAAVGN